MRAVGHAVRREDSGSETFLKNRTHAVRGYRTHETHTRRTRDERLGPDQRFQTLRGTGCSGVAGEARLRGCSLGCGATGACRSRAVRPSTSV